MTLQELAALYTTPSVLFFCRRCGDKYSRPSSIRLCLLLFWDYSGDTTAHAMRVCCILYMHGTIFGRQKKQNVLECGNKYKRTCVCAADCFVRGARKEARPSCAHRQKTWSWWLVRRLCCPHVRRPRPRRQARSVPRTAGTARGQAPSTQGTLPGRLAPFGRAVTDESKLLYASARPSVSRWLH